MASQPSTLVSPAGAPEANSTQSQKQWVSCNTCSASKIKCSKEKPECFRCMKRGITCQYAVTKRSGRKQRTRQRSNSISSSPMDVVSGSDTLVLPDNVAQMSPMPSITEYTDCSTSLVDPATSSILLLNALNWGFDDLPSPSSLLSMSADMVNPYLCDDVTTALQQSEASCPVPEPAENHSSTVEEPGAGPTCCFLVRALGLLKQQSSARESCGGLQQEDGTTQPGNNTEYQIETNQNPPNVVDTHSGGFDEDQICMASQQIIGRLHRIQRLINILSERFKTHKVSVKGRQDDEPKASTTDGSSNMFTFMFPSSVLEHIEADLRLHLRTLSVDAANILRQA
ncbi:conserved hypothetical protein [Talaromyces stipitatus ATCC 10500]|uniref:Zn(2)-C6 fungal-type domain-containing protein n=1 Tax=Talaromyces stipitatus (strain ATCC 10500 / CBS 375.48 / QM 6759 / NRRL 1006) TaxID=441959 RepID=B8MB18_TALSN|nr:uncharacterized protein TSTA_124430 [Talaromyces stipitatus ATCC 10500]EED18719.1 conserved hypothetical protein [Talaromyces stipitatus ATCC 10500]